MFRDKNSTEKIIKILGLNIGIAVVDIIWVRLICQSGQNLRTIG